MNETRRVLDWSEAYARLERARQALDAGQQRAPDDARRILAERARALAKPVDDAASSRDVRELLTFSVAGERYGIAAASVVEVIPLRELVKLPGTSRAVVGIMNHRGRVLPVVDLRRVFGLSGEGLPDDGRVVVAASGGSTFGIFAEIVAGVVSIDVEELQTRPTHLGGDRGTVVLWVTPDLVAVLDIEALANDPRITVNEEIG